MGDIAGNLSPLFYRSSQGTMETMLSGAICGLIYHFFAGQPLTIMGATGPLLIFETLLYAFCK